MLVRCGPAPVAQWIERRFPKPCVAGSIPAWGASCFGASRSVKPVHLWVGCRSVCLVAVCGAWSSQLSRVRPGGKFSLASIGARGSFTSPTGATARLADFSVDVSPSESLMSRFTVAKLRAFVPAERRPYECALVYPGVVSARQCDRILDQAADLVTDQAHVGDGVEESEHDEAIRRSRISWIPDDELHSWIYDKLAKVVGRANRYYKFDLIGFTEDLQFTEYAGAGSFYTWHQDGLDGELAVRKLSMVVQLSDPDHYAGGELELFGFDCDESDAASERRAKMRQRGTVVVFPAFEHHRVTPLLSGTRRSLVCWIGGPPFR